MTSYPLRLPPELKELGQAKAHGLGISFNALVCIALDSFLRGPEASPAVRVPSPALAVPTPRREPLDEPPPKRQKPVLEAPPFNPPPPPPEPEPKLNRAQRRALKKRK